MNTAQIETNLQKLMVTINKENFIYELLLAYGLPKASITRLKKGNLNLSKVEGEISWKKKLFFREEQKEDLHLTITKIAKELKHNERFVIVTDYKTLLAIDTKTDDKLDCDLTDLLKHYDFFLPWAGMEKAQHANENPADVKAAEKMAKLFDEIKKDNPDDSPEFIHGLNVFLSRLLFCFFAEDTNIFEDNQFTNAIDSHTQHDGSDLDTFLDRIFTILNTPENKRDGLPEYLKAFPFVNGGLFEKEYKTPIFTRHSRQVIIDAGELKWSAINPDIFGSMFQAVIGAEQRGSLGQHYTSVPNIMKVIEPLFLNDLYEELEKAVKAQGLASQKKLNALLHRIYNLKIFDPACGSGNFLIIAYKELCILEMKIFKALEITKKRQRSMPFSGIQLSQFYGIEIDDFAGEIAKLALWLAEHQMNVEFFAAFGRTNPTLPLKEAGKIVQGNACRLDWEDVCPKNENDEIYILGNPPYLGYNLQTKEQKNDLFNVFNEYKDYKKLDYIACWFYLGKKYINSKQIRIAFVSTNSICQGEQVPILWPKLLNNNIEISFAYQPFKWQNNAKSNAGVTVVIIGLQKCSSTNKNLYSQNRKQSVQNINSYLTSGNNLIVKKRTQTISDFPIMMKGSQPTDAGNLLLNETEKEKIIRDYPVLQNYIKKFMGTKEFLDNIEKYCFWIEADEIGEIRNISEISVRLDRVKENRLKSTKKATNELAEKPWMFGERRYYKKNAIIVPTISSERRPYFPADFVKPDTVISNTAQSIYYQEPYIFGVVSSKMMIKWVEAVGGKFESRYIFSSQLCYNTFPFPPISTQRKNEITQAVFRILEEREKHSDKTLAQLYDPDKMPEGLREAHRQNDIIIEKCYRSTPFNSDEERLEYLFKLYEKMIAEEKEQGTLFAKEKPKRRKKK